MAEIKSVSRQSINEDAASLPGAQTNARRLRIEPDPVTAIPRNELTPSVMRLIDELASLKTELSAAQQRVAELEVVADEDPLVPALNRRGFMRELDRAIAYFKRYQSEIALIYIDLNDFKGINDTYGHAAGDEALRHMAELLCQNVRKSDIVGRLGGDEFAIVLQKAELNIAETKAQQLEEAARRFPLAFQGRTIPVDLSAGAAAVLESDNAETALERADEAMFARKEAIRAGALSR